MKFATLLRCSLAALMLLVGTTADAQGFFRTWRANRAARVEARATARQYQPETRYTSYTVEGMDCSGGVCHPTTFRYTTAPTVVRGSYRETTTAGFVGSASSHGGTASYVGYSAAPPSRGSDGGGPIYEAQSQQAHAKPEATQQSQACTCDGDCNCPDCPCNPANAAEVDPDDGLDVFGYQPIAPDSDDGASVFAFRPSDAEPFAYHAKPAAGAIVGL